MYLRAEDAFFVFIGCPPGFFHVNLVFLLPSLAFTLPDLAFLLTALSFPLPYQVHYALVGIVYG